MSKRDIGMKLERCGWENLPGRYVPEVQKGDSEERGQPGPEEVTDRIL